MSRDDQELRDLILLASLPHMVFEGWSVAAMEAGIGDLKDMAEIDADTAGRAFPGGMADMAEHFSDWADRRMLAEMVKLDMEALKVRERVAAGVRCRLEALGPYREAVRRCLTYMTLPQNAGLSMKCTCKTVSEIWYAVGDESADFSFYSKRALLVPVLGATTLYWLGDEGDEDGDFPETWSFLDRRVGDVVNIFQARVKLSKRLAEIPSPITILKRFAAAAAQARR
jgi:ubiquinone biosynthesis protein COQ9